MIPPKTSSHFTIQRSVFQGLHVVLTKCHGEEHWPCAVEMDIPPLVHYVMSYNLKVNICTEKHYVYNFKVKLC